MDFYARYKEGESLSTKPSERVLVKAIQTISQHFISTYLLVDGLDECGQSFEDRREKLIHSLSTLHQSSSGLIRSIIFSREEQDIKDALVGSFNRVSIAATSADLRLYVNSWLPSLRIHSLQVGVEVVDTLVEKAEGM